MDQDAGELRLAVFVGDGVIDHALPRHGSVTLGRADSCDIRIDHPAVSRRHARLHLGPPLRIEDLGGAGGTFLRDPRAPSQQGDTQGMKQISRRTAELGVGDAVVLGSTMVVVRRAPSAGEGRGDARSAAPDPEVPGGRAMRSVYEQAYLAAGTPITVLLLGETGVGKEVMAQAIHDRSPRASGPFIAIHCSALSESLLESELFGHERGAFTGAVHARAGLFESAEGGTIFLDEIGELSRSVQVKLLRFLEDRKVKRVGGQTSRPIDVRFIAATNRDLEAEMARGNFREDLFFRLSPMTLTIPPLRDRLDEIAPLARRLVERACLHFNRARAPELSGEVLEVLGRYRWPGNVRELRNVVERAVVLCAGDRLLPEHFAPRLQMAVEPEAPLPRAPTPASPGTDEPLNQLRSAMDAIERQRIVAALQQCNGNQTYAAELLGIARRTLVTKIRDHQIPRPRKRPDPGPDRGSS